MGRRITCRPSCGFPSSNSATAEVFGWDHCSNILTFHRMLNTTEICDYNELSDHMVLALLEEHQLQCVQFFKSLCRLFETTFQ
ncbi:hypothetical protein EYF80_026605 [Liparis tanakae]|uniref:Uncharacterized protein n=1 Tax=Liparis tanakae TaxID=230148 RepID=A0A4Z2HBY6_9TELE|nr:hypothetical protein EYF80_026605 [Liparis tanakae]